MPPVESYDALVPPDGPQWLTTPDQERLRLVMGYHDAIGDRGENAHTHCTLHVIVENQLAMGGTMEPVRERLRQLMAQGLDRHDAVHAVAYVLARHLGRLGQLQQPAGDRDDWYFRDLKRMTARKWMGVLRGLRG